MTGRARRVRAREPHGRIEPPQRRPRVHPAKLPPLREEVPRQPERGIALRNSEIRVGQRRAREGCRTIGLRREAPVSAGRGLRRARALRHEGAEQRALVGPGRLRDAREERRRARRVAPREPLDDRHESGRPRGRRQLLDRRGHIERHHRRRARGQQTTEHVVRERTVATRHDSVATRNLTVALRVCSVATRNLTVAPRWLSVAPRWLSVAPRCGHAASSHVDRREPSEPERDERRRALAEGRLAGRIARRRRDRLRRRSNGGERRRLVRRRRERQQRRRPLLRAGAHLHAQPHRRARRDAHRPARHADRHEHRCPVLAALSALVRRVRASPRPKLPAILRASLRPKLTKTLRPKLCARSPDIETQRAHLTVSGATHGDARHCLHSPRRHVDRHVARHKEPPIHPAQLAARRRPLARHAREDRRRSLGERPRMHARGQPHHRRHPDRPVNRHRRRVDPQRTGREGLRRLPSNRHNGVRRADGHSDRKAPHPRHEPRPARHAAGHRLAKRTRRARLGHRRRPRHADLGSSHDGQRPPPDLCLPREPRPRGPVVAARVPEREPRREIRRLGPYGPRPRIEDRQRHAHGDAIVLVGPLDRCRHAEPEPLRSSGRDLGAPIEQRLHDAPPKRPRRRRRQLLRRLKRRASRPHSQRPARRDRRREREQNGLRARIADARSRRRERAKRPRVPRARRGRERTRHRIDRALPRHRIGRQFPRHRIGRAFPRHRIGSVRGGLLREGRGVAPVQKEPLHERRPVPVRGHTDRHLPCLHVRPQRPARGHEEPHAQGRRSTPAARELERPHGRARHREHDARRPRSPRDLQPDDVGLGRRYREAPACRNGTPHSAIRRIEEPRILHDFPTSRHSDGRPREHERRERPPQQPLLHERERQPRTARRRAGARPHRVAHRRQEPQRRRHRLRRSGGRRRPRAARPLHGVLLEPLPPERIHLRLRDGHPQPRRRPRPHDDSRRRRPVRHEPRHPAGDRRPREPRDRLRRIRVARGDPHIEVLRSRRPRHAHPLPRERLDPEAPAGLDSDILVPCPEGRRPARRDRLHLGDRRPREPRGHRRRAPAEGHDPRQEQGERRSLSHRRAGSPAKARLTGAAPSLRTKSSAANHAGIREASRHSTKARSSMSSVASPVARGGSTLR